MINPNMFFELYSEAAWTKNVDMMTQLYSDDITMYDLWNNGYFHGRASVKKNIRDWFLSLGSDHVEVKFEDMKTIENENLALSFGLIQYAGISKEGEVLRSMKNRISLGFIKTRDEWNVIHQHTSLPINSVDMKAHFNI